MTQPRFIVPGETIMVTARTVARFYLLRPDPKLSDAIRYLLGHYAAKYEITLHAVCVMSTHYHIVAHDKLGNRSLFLRDLNRGIANVVKAMHGWRGPVFRPKPNIVRLLTERAIVHKVAYVLANPVAAGAVSRAKEWPGICEAADTETRARTVKRPGHFFSEHGRLPKQETYRLQHPESLLLRGGEKQAAKELSREARKLELQARTQVTSNGWKVLGPQRCLRLSPFKRARAYEVFGSREPTFSTLGGGKALYKLAAKQLQTFRREHREALLDWRERKRSVMFPYGTWLMRILHSVNCAPRRLDGPLWVGAA